MYTIYKYTNTINNKCYIGKTKSPTVRHKFHERADGSSPHFHAAIRKYTFGSFEKQVLKENILTNEEAGTWERYFIDHFDSRKGGYNIAKGGEGGFANIKYDEAIIKEMLIDSCCHRDASIKYNIPFSYIRTLRTNNDLYPHLVRLPEYKRGFVKKLSESEVIEILNDPGDKYQMSEKYGVKLSTIDDIRLGRTWKYITRKTDHRKRVVHKRTRLTEETVINILFDDCSHKEAAEKYSIKHSTVCGIRANTLTKWKYIDRSMAPVYERSNSRT